MGAVAFAFGDQPTIAELDAVALSELLGHRHTVSAATAARKIKTEALKQLEPEMKSGGVELTRGEMLALHAVLTEYCATPPVADAVARLRQELKQTMAHSHR